MRKVNIHHGRTHKYEVRTIIGECLFASDFFDACTHWVAEHGHVLRQGTTTETVLPAYVFPAVYDHPEESNKRRTLTCDRFQVTSRHGLESCHKTFMLALSSANRLFKKLREEEGGKPSVEIYDAMARVGKPQVWHVTGTTLGDYVIAMVHQKIPNAVTGAH
jgi:hypothetical protein